MTRTQQSHILPQHHPSWFLCLAWAWLALTVMASAALAQDLVIESWRKDDQLLWDKVLIPAFQRQHPGIRLSFRAEEPLAYDARVESRLSTRRAGDLVFCRPFDGSVRMHAKGYLLPLKARELENFSPQARQAWTTDDGQTTYCLPVAFVMHGLFYNKKVFKDLGLTPPVTVDEFLRLLGTIGASGNITPLALGTADMWESPKSSSPAWAPTFGVAKKPGWD